MEKVETLVEQIRKDLEDGKSEGEIFQSLLPPYGRDPKFDRQLIESLGAIPHEKIANVLQRLLEVSSEKGVRKIIKRSLYRLKSRGIAVEETPLKKEESILRPAQIESPKGFSNSYDSSWNRFILMTLPHPARGLTLLHGLINDTKGLLHFSGGEISRKEFRSFFEEVQKTSPTPLVEMEPSYVAFLFTQAFRLTLGQGGTPPQGYFQLKGEVEKIRRDYEKPLVYSYLQADEIAGDDRMLRRGGDLLKTDLFYSWRIEEDQIRPYADEIWEAEESKIVLNPAQKEARFQGIYQKALSELFSGEKRILFKRRLEEMAYLLLKLGREEEARVSFAVAIDLERPLNPIQTNPFLFQLVVKSIFTLLAEAYEKRSKEASLIVKP